MHVSCCTFVLLQFPCLFGIPCLLLLRRIPFFVECFSLLSQGFRGCLGRKIFVFFGHLPCFLPKSKESKSRAFANAQTQTNADVRLSEKGPKTQVNVHKHEQTQATADKREQLQNQRITPPFTHPLLWQPNSLLCATNFRGNFGPTSWALFRQIQAISGNFEQIRTFLIISGNLRVRKPRRKQL